MIYETQEQLDAALIKWQRILRLQDWRIIAQLRSAKETEDCWGKCFPRINKKEAAIFLMRHTDYRVDEADTFPLDHEEVLVHELLHVHFEPFSPTDEDALDYKMMEQATETIATCLVAMDRGRQQ